jgi:hypothetical protein
MSLTGLAQAALATMLDDQLSSVVDSTCTDDDSTHRPAAAVDVAEAAAESVLEGATVSELLTLALHCVPARACTRLLTFRLIASCTAE